MRSNLIKYTLFFIIAASGILLISGLVYARYMLNTPNIKDLIISSIPTIFISLLGSKFIINSYRKKQWQVSRLNTALSAALGFFLSLGISLPSGMPILVIIFVVVITVMFAILGILCSSIGSVSVLLSGSFSGAICYLISRNPNLSLIGFASNFLGSIIFISSYISVFILMARSPANALSNRRNDSTEVLLLELLEVAKEKQGLLTKAEIMQALKINIQTADELVKEAEIGNLLTVEVDESTGILKYNFHI